MNELSSEASNLGMWRLLPVTPTVKMLDAMHSNSNGVIPGQTILEKYRERYDRLLASAPDAPASDVQELSGALLGLMSLWDNVETTDLPDDVVIALSRAHGALRRSNGGAFPALPDGTTGDEWQERNPDIHAAMVELTSWAGACGIRYGASSYLRIPETRAEAHEWEWARILKLRAAIDRALYAAGAPTLSGQATDPAAREETRP